MEALSRTGPGVSSACSFALVSFGDPMLRRVLGALIVLLLIAASARAQDAIDLSQAAVYNSPTDIASWPVTTTITRLEMQPTGAPAEGVSLVFSAQNTWPDYTPPGWGGPLQYTVWAVLKINGQWVTSGFIQMWNGRPSTGAPILADFALDWAYDGRWGPMAGYQPQVGEQMGFFVSAGNARGVGTVTSVRERSNVVLVNLPANDTGVFTFAGRGNTTTVLTGDFNADGRPDLLTQTDTGLVTLSVNTGTSFDPVVSAYNGITSAWRIVDVGDLNGDGRPDLVWQGPTGAVVVWLNNGAAAPSAQYLYNGASDWRVVAVADMDRDGNPDLIWQSVTGRVVVWLMHGTSFFAAQDVWPGASAWRVAGARDLDGDGNVDLLWQGPTGAVVVWLMHGTALASTQYVYNGASAWQVNSVGDLDGDGKPDILWRGPTGQIVAWMMQGITASQYKYLKADGSGWQLSATP
jgi:hypothetical protein